MESKMPKGEKSDKEPLWSGGFYTPYPLTEEQKSRFLKYRGISLPNGRQLPHVQLFDGEVKVDSIKSVFLGRYFEVFELTEQHRKFDESMSKLYTWQISRRKPFVTVLIHNVPTDEILLVEQFRPATKHIDGLPNGNPYKKHGRMLELVAGGLGPDNPKECAKREALEEAGMKLDTLVEMPGGFTSPGGSDEYGFLFYAPVFSRDPVPGQGGGLQDENEDTKVHWVKFDKAMSMCLFGVINDNKTIIGILFGEKFRLIE